jgi:hypothetical protein
MRKILLVWSPWLAADAHALYKCTDEKGKTHIETRRRRSATA